MERVAAIRSMFDAKGSGLEIGRSYSPLILKSEGFKVDILDHANLSHPLIFRSGRFTTWGKT
jgi:hypothetical protein